MLLQAVILLYEVELLQRAKLAQDSGIEDDVR